MPINIITADVFQDAKDPLICGLKALTSSTALNKSSPLQVRELVQHSLQRLESLEIGSQFKLENDTVENMLSLSDMKLLSYLVKFLVSAGLYAGLTPAEVKLRQSRLDPEFAPLAGLLDSSDRETVSSKFVEFLTQDSQLSRVLNAMPFISDLVYTVTVLEKDVQVLLDKLPTQVLYESLLTILQWNIPQHLSAYFGSMLSLIPLRKHDAIKSFLSIYAGLSDGQISAGSPQIDKIALTLVVPPKTVSASEFYRALAQQYSTILINPTTPQNIIDLLLMTMSRVETIRPSALKEFRDLAVRPFEVADEKPLQPALTLLINLAKRDTPLVRYLLSRLCVPIYLCYEELMINNKDTTQVKKLLLRTVDLCPDTLYKISNHIGLEPSKEYLRPELKNDDVRGLCLVMSNSAHSTDSVAQIRNAERQVHVFVELLRLCVESTICDFVCRLLRDVLQYKNEHPPTMLIKGQLLGLIFAEIGPVLQKSSNRLLEVLVTIIDEVLQNIGSVQDNDFRDNELLNTCFSITTDLVVETITYSKTTINVETLQKLLDCTSAFPKYAEKAQELMRMFENSENGFGGEARQSDLPAQVIEVARQSIDSPIIPIKAYGVSLLKGLIGKQLTTQELTDIADLLCEQIQEEDSFVHVAATTALEKLAGNCDPNLLIDRLLTVSPTLSMPPDVTIRFCNALKQIARIGGNQITQRTVANLLTRLKSIDGTTDIKVQQTISALCCEISK